MDIYDVHENVDLLRKLGVDIKKHLPDMVAAEKRQQRMSQIGYQAKEAADRQPHVLLGELDLDDADAVIAAVDRVAYMQNKEHRARVSDIFEDAYVRADGEIKKAFKRADFLGILRPVFDTLSARITTAAETIPYGVMNIGDAARFKLADMYGQLEEDAEHWGDIETLLGRLISAGVIKLDDEYYGIEMMVEDSEAYRETRASSSSPMRVARAVVAGRPNLRKPTEPHVEYHATYGQARDSDGWKAYDATEAEKAARTALGLS